MTLASSSSERRVAARSSLEGRDPRRAVAARGIPGGQIRTGGLELFTSRAQLLLHRTDLLVLLRGLLLLREELLLGGAQCLALARARGLQARLEVGRPRFGGRQAIASLSEHGRVFGELRLQRGDPRGLLAGATLALRLELRDQRPEGIDLLLVRAHACFPPVDLLPELGHLSLEMRDRRLALRDTVLGVRDPRSCVLRCRLYLLGVRLRFGRPRLGLSEAGVGVLAPGVELVPRRVQQRDDVTELPILGLQLLRAPGTGRAERLQLLGPGGDEPLALGQFLPDGSELLAGRIELLTDPVQLLFLAPRLGLVARDGGLERL